MDEETRKELLGLLASEGPNVVGKRKECRFEMPVKEQDEGKSERRGRASSMLLQKKMPLKRTNTLQRGHANSVFMGAPAASASIAEAAIPEEPAEGQG